MATDQRYCLQCGHALGGNRDELLDAVGLGEVREPCRAPLANPSAALVETDRGTSRPGVVVRRWSPGLATAVVGFMLATGIAVGAGTGPHHAPVGTASALATAQARAALLAVLAERRAAAPAAVPVASPAPTAKAAPTVKVTPAAPAPAAPVTPVVTPTAAPIDDAATTPAADDDTPATTPAATTPLPTVTNVWVIGLPGTSIDAAAADSAPASILRDAIMPQGVLLAGYTLLSGTAPANAIAAISGQPPTLASQDGCVTPTDVAASTIDAKTGIATGDGCRYPAQAPSVAAQLSDGGSVVRSYDSAEGSGCAGATTPANVRAPLPYFHAFTGAAECADRSGDPARLGSDLADPASTPTFSWITAPDDPAAAQQFAADTVAAITATDAYKAGGLILILPDAADPASPSDLAVGAVAISPFITATTRNETEFGPYGVLRLVEDLFTLPALAGAGAEDVPQIDRSIFAAKAAGARAHHQPTHRSSS